MTVVDITIISLFAVIVYHAVLRLLSCSIRVTV